MKAVEALGEELRPHGGQRRGPAERLGGKPAECSRRPRNRRPGQEPGSGRPRHPPIGTPDAKSPVKHQRGEPAGGVLVEGELHIPRKPTREANTPDEWVG